MKHLLRSLLCLCLILTAALHAETVSTTVTVASTATQVLATSGAERNWVMISVPSTAARAVFIGINDAAVTTSTGHELQPGETLTLINAPASAGSVHPAWNKIYAIVATSTVGVVVSYGD